MTFIKDERVLRIQSRIAFIGDDTVIISTYHLIQVLHRIAVYVKVHATFLIQDGITEKICFYSAYIYFLIQAIDLLIKLFFYKLIDPRVVIELVIISRVTEPHEPDKLPRDKRKMIAAKGLVYNLGNGHFQKGGFVGWAFLRRNEGREVYRQRKN